jgi:hypothetical protein
MLKFSEKTTMHACPENKLDGNRSSLSVNNKKGTDDPRFEQYEYWYAEFYLYVDVSKA